MELDDVRRGPRGWKAARPLVLAVALIFLLNPVISWFERRGVHRLLGTLGIYLIFLLAVGLAIAAIAPPLSTARVRGSGSLPA